MRKRLLFPLAVFTAMVISAGTTFAQSECKKMDAIEAIMTRSSVRSYTSQPVEAEKVETMLRAAMAAPTGMNKQPWKFYVVESREKLDEIASRIPGMKMAAQAQLAVAVCGDLEKAGDSKNWINDTSAAAENLLISANALGLGAVWTGGYPNTERVEILQEVLGMPESIVPTCFIPIGYPDSEPQIKDKWNPDAIVYVK